MVCITTWSCHVWKDCVTQWLSMSVSRFPNNTSDTVNHCVTQSFIRDKSKECHSMSRERLKNKCYVTSQCSCWFHIAGLRKDSRLRHVTTPCLTHATVISIPPWRRMWGGCLRLILAVIRVFSCLHRMWTTHNHPWMPGATWRRNTTVTMTAQQVDPYQGHPQTAPHHPVNKPICRGRIPLRMCPLMTARTKMMRGIGMVRVQFYKNDLVYFYSEMHFACVTSIFQLVL